MTQQEAEQQIAAILQRLEVHTRCLVKAVEIEDLEITSLGDTQRQLERSVHIKLDPQPGTRWRV